MGLQQADTVQGNSGIGAGVQDSFFLALATWGVDRLPLAIAGGTDATDDCIDFVAIPLCIGQPLKYHQAQAFAQDGAVSRNIKRLGIARG